MPVNWRGVDSRQSSGEPDSRGIMSTNRASVIKRLIAETAVPAEGTHRKLAFPLLPDQARPLLLLRGYCLDSSHPSHYRALPDSGARGVRRVLTIRHGIFRWPVARFF